MAFLSKELATDRRTFKRHLESLDADVFVRSMSGETRRLVIQSTAQSKAAEVDLPAEQFSKIASRACAECVLGENKEPIADESWWYNQPVDVLKECWGFIEAASGLRSTSSEAAKKNLIPTTKNGSSTESAAELATPTLTS